MEGDDELERIAFEVVGDEGLASCLFVKMELEETTEGRDEELGGDGGRAVIPGRPVMPGTVGGINPGGRCGKLG
jgi:hypothetical protein